MAAGTANTALDPLNFPRCTLQGVGNGLVGRARSQGLKAAVTSLSRLGVGGGGGWLRAEGRRRGRRLFPAALLCNFSRR